MGKGERPRTGVGRTEGLTVARATKLKVYRTPIGFHDAYVAAPSQKAALVAWGSDADLFARGIAERVVDPKLVREPLTKPGTVIKRSRGTTAEQLAALPPDKPRKPVAKSEPATEQATKANPKRQPKPKPRLRVPRSMPPRRPSSMRTTPTLISARISSRRSRGSRGNVESSMHGTTPNEKGSSRDVPPPRRGMSRH